MSSTAIRDQPIETNSMLQDKQFAGPVEVAEVNGANIKDENDFGSTKVKTVTSSAKAEAGKVRYKFPPHSYTMLKAKLAG